MNFSRSPRKFCLRLHYNGAKSYSFVNGTKIYQFKVNDSKIKNIPCVWEAFQNNFLLIV